MEDMKMIRPHFCAFMCSTTPLTRMNPARKLMFIVWSNSSSEIFDKSGIRLPYPAFDIRMSGRWPCSKSICWNIVSISSLDPTSTWWIEMRSFCVAFLECISATILFKDVKLVEYVKARWTPCCASCCAQAAPILKPENWRKSASCPCINGQYHAYPPDAPVITANLPRMSLNAIFADIRSPSILTRQED